MQVICARGEWDGNIRAAGTVQRGAHDEARVRQSTQSRIAIDSDHYLPRVGSNRSIDGGAFNHLWSRSARYVGARWLVLFGKIAGVGVGGPTQSFNTLIGHWNRDGIPPIGAAALVPYYSGPAD